MYIAKKKKKKSSFFLFLLFQKQQREKELNAEIVNHVDDKNTLTDVFHSTTIKYQDEPLSFPSSENKSSHIMTARSNNGCATPEEDLDDTAASHIELALENTLCPSVLLVETERREGDTQVVLADQVDETAEIDPFPLVENNKLVEGKTPNVSSLSNQGNMKRNDGELDVQGSNLFRASKKELQDVVTQEEDIPTEEVLAQSKKNVRQADTSCLLIQQKKLSPKGRPIRKCAKTTLLNPEELNLKKVHVGMKRGRTGFESDEDGEDTKKTNQSNTLHREISPEIPLQDTILSNSAIASRRIHKKKKSLEFVLNTIQENKQDLRNKGNAGPFSYEGSSKSIDEECTSVVIRQVAVSTGEEKNNTMVDSKDGARTGWGSNMNITSHENPSVLKKKATLFRNHAHRKSDAFKLPILEVEVNWLISNEMF